MKHEKIEAIVLGAILMEKGAYHVVSNILQPDYFTGWHEEVYTAIVEVNADGNIHIYGTLRGRAIAGASGAQDAAIYCQQLKAELVSINGSYWLSESLQGEYWEQPAQITQRNESLEITALVKG